MQFGTVSYVLHECCQLYVTPRQMNLGMTSEFRTAGLAAWLSTDLVVVMILRLLCGTLLLPLPRQSTLLLQHRYSRFCQHWNYNLPLPHQHG